MLHASLHEQEIRRLIDLPGGGDRIVEGLAPLGADEDNCLYFINRKLTDAERESLAARRGCIVLSQKSSALGGGLGDCLVLEVAQPRAAVAKLLKFIRDEGRQPPLVTRIAIASSAIISPLAVVEGNVEIGDAAVVEPFCVIGPDVRIGSGTVLCSGVRVFPRVTIGDYSRVGANSVVGHEGYGFVRHDASSKTRMPHLGGVLIGSHVEIGAMATVQGGTISPTLIEDYAKLDDHVHIGHNVRIARGASVTAAVVIAGHAIVETEAWIGINASVRDGCRVGSHALIGMDASVQHDLPDDSIARAPRPTNAARTDYDSAAIGFKKS